MLKIPTITACSKVFLRLSLILKLRDAYLPQGWPGVVNVGSHEWAQFLLVSGALRRSEESWLFYERRPAIEQIEHTIATQGYTVCGCPSRSPLAEHSGSRRLLHKLWSPVGRAKCGGCHVRNGPCPGCPPLGARKAANVTKHLYSNCMYNSCVVEDERMG